MVFQGDDLRGEHHHPEIILHSPLLLMLKKQALLISRAREEFSSALFYYSCGNNKEALNSAKSAALTFNSALDLGSETPQILPSELSTALTVYEGLKKDQDILDVSTRIVYISSRINGKLYLPWNFDPLETEFELEGSEIEGIEADKSETDHLAVDELSSNQFIDPDGLLVLSQNQNDHFLKWNRPTRALNVDRPFISSTGAQSIYQDALENCSFVASLVSIVFFESRTGRSILLPRLYPQNDGLPYISPSGKYVIKLHFNGSIRRVVIDDLLPTSAQDGHNLFVRSHSNPGLLWPCLFEKAYLKVMGGYDFPGSHAARDTFVLTSWIPDYIYLKEYFEHVDSSRPALWRKIYEAFNGNKAMICIGTGPLSCQESKALGLIGEHDYTVIDMKELEEEGEVKRLLLIKNPWLSSKAYSKQEDEESLPYIFESPGCFWVEFNLLCLRFQSIYLNWNPDMFAHNHSVHMLWPNSGATSGFLASNPQYCIANDSTQSIQVWALLDRHYVDRKQVGGFIALDLYESQGYKVYLNEEKPIKIQGTRMNTMYHLLQFTVPAATAYTLVVEASDIPVEVTSARFTMTCYSHSEFSLARAKDELTFKANIKGQWNKDSSGGSWTNGFYIRNPQFKLDIKSKTDRLNIYLNSSSSTPINIQLFYSKGKEVQNFQSQDVVATSGKYKVGNALCRCRFLDPGSYTAIVSTFEPGILASFSLSIRSSAEVSLNPIVSDTMGLFSRSITRQWNGTNRQQLEFKVGHQCQAKFHLQTVKVLESDSISNHASPSHYRPHLRFSIFHGNSNARMAFSQFSDNVFGIYLDNIVLRADELYICLIERMELGYGSFKMTAYSGSPVDFTSN